MHGSPEILLWCNMKNMVLRTRFYLIRYLSLKYSIAGSRAAQFSYRPGDYLPLHFGLNFRNPSYIYIRACCIIYICSLYHSVHKFTTNNPNLCIIGLEIFNWKYWFDNLSVHLLQHIEAETRWPTFCRQHFQVHFLEWRYMNFDWYFIEYCSWESN